MQSASEGKLTGPASAGPVFDAAETVIRLVTGCVLSALVLLVCLEAVLRGGFDYSLGFAEELTGYCAVVLTFLGAALALRQGALFRVHFFYDALAPGARLWLTRTFVVLALIICAVLAWKTKDLMLSSFTRGKFAATVLRTPLWIPQLVPPAGFAILGLFLVEQLLLTFARFRKEP